MKYKLIGDGNLFNIKETILTNRGIHDIGNFLNVSAKHVYDYELIENIKLACHTIMQSITNKEKIFIMIDSDCDGYTSSAIMLNYLKRVDPDADIVCKMHKDKEHGIKSEYVANDIGLVIVPDAGTNDIVECKKLQDRGIKVVIVD